MYLSGGYRNDQRGKRVGEGKLYHFRQLIKELCPWFDFNIYTDLILEAWVGHDTVGIAGPASTGKTMTCAMASYAEFFCRPKGTTVIMSSITLEGLKLRVWGAMVEILHKVQELRPNAPGHLVPSERRIYAEPPTDEQKNDPRDAIMGIACKQGDTFVGVMPFVGIKNDYIFLVADEASLMPGGFWDATANLRKGGKHGTKFVALGNPKDYYDALGRVCEPSQELGGWEGLAYSEHCRTWKTRGGNGVAVQLSGLDTPNGKDKEGKPTPGKNRFSYLITPEAIEEDRLRFGLDSWQFQMMDLGVWPRGESSKRVITRAICEAGNAFGEPLWDGNTPTTDYVGLDAAYSGVGGDRTPLIRVRTGKDINGVWILAVVDGPIIVPIDLNKRDADDKPIPSEDQIALYTKEYCEKNHVPSARVGFDSTGRGSLASAFARIWNPAVVAIEFGGQPPEGRRILSHDPRTEREEHVKMVSALWFAARNLITMKQCRALPQGVFEEGTMREFYESERGKTDVEKKEKTSKRLGRSPDLFDSFVVCLEVARRNGFNIGHISSGKIVATSKWLNERRDRWRETVNREVLNEA